MGALALAQAVMALLPVAIEHGPEVVNSFKALIATITGGGKLTAEEQAQFDAEWKAMGVRLGQANTDWENATRS